MNYDAKDYESKPGLCESWGQLAWFVAKCFFWSLVVAAFVIGVLAL